MKLREEYRPMFNDDEQDIRTDGSYVFDEDDISANRGIAIAAYFLWFLPLLIARDSHFARFHANQSLLIFIVLALCGIITLVVPICGYIIGIICGAWFGVVPWFSCLMTAIKGGVKRANYYGQFNIISL